jgi:hypothetical protein
MAPASYWYWRCFILEYCTPLHCTALHWSVSHCSVLLSTPNCSSCYTLKSIANHTMLRNTWSSYTTLHRVFRTYITVRPFFLRDLLTLSVLISILRDTVPRLPFYLNHMCLATSLLPLCVFAIRPSEVWILEVTDGGNPAGRVGLERYGLLVLVLVLPLAVAEPA